MKRLASVILILLLLPMTCGAEALLSGVMAPEMTVGAEIAPEDITDFYFTYDASTDPPHWQRYRLYRVDGGWFFYHETREGGGWPQTEEDITASGTVALTEERRSSFLALLEGGKARIREESLDTGDSGPWLFLYWDGGEAEGRAFTFETREKRAEFEALCESLAAEQASGGLAYFFLTRGGYNVPQTYEVTREGDGYLLRENDGEPRPLDSAYADALWQVIQEYDLFAWDGFSESNPYVLDGESFSIAFTAADGRAAEAHGVNAFPPQYHPVTDRLDRIFVDEKRSLLAGDYRYDGAGGAFAISLRADGTFAIDGGGGDWYPYTDVIYLTSRDGGGDYLFWYADDALIYSESASDAFPGADVPDEAEFVRIKQE